MRIEVSNQQLELDLLASVHNQWVGLALHRDGHTLHGSVGGMSATITLTPDTQGLAYRMSFHSPFRTRVRLRLRRAGALTPFHLIPGNIHGDNNAAHVRSGEFPCLTDNRTTEINRSSIWEFRADRASHPVSILHDGQMAFGVSIDPYSASDETDDAFIRNGVFAALPDTFGVSLGYGNDPATFFNRTVFEPATRDIVHRATANGRIVAIAGDRRASHAIIELVYRDLHDRPAHKRSERDALRALAESFATISFRPELNQYTNCNCEVPVRTELRPWRVIGEIGWTGGSMLAYPFELTERLLPGTKLPKSGARILDEICTGWNERSGLLLDNVVNRYTTNRPEGWNNSELNGWWSGYIGTRDNHCAYTNAHAAYYLLRTAQRRRQWGMRADPKWEQTALRVLSTAIELQRDDGAFGYIFSGSERKVLDFNGFAGCWFAAALPMAFALTGETHFRESAERAIDYYATFVRNLAAWGSPMDTCYSIDSEGNLAFIRAARLMHEATRDDRYLDLLRDGAHYEYLWRYGFRSRPACAPLKDSTWNSCGGSITSVSNPHMHPMSVVVTPDLEYLARHTAGSYHQDRADDGIAWLLNTMELYPEVMGYGRYGVLSERTCPSDALLSERYRDTGLPASTWWSYNAWAGGSAMEALAERLLMKGGTS